MHTVRWYVLCHLNATSIHFILTLKGLPCLVSMLQQKIFKSFPQEIRCFLHHIFSFFLILPAYHCSPHGDSKGIFFSYAFGWENIMTACNEVPLEKEPFVHAFCLWGKSYKDKTGACQIILQRDLFEEIWSSVEAVHIGHLPQYHTVYIGDPSSIL